MVALDRPLNYRLHDQINQSLAFGQWLAIKVFTPAQQPGNPGRDGRPFRPARPWLAPGLETMLKLNRRVAVSRLARYFLV
jgi:hypothetical protein